MSKPRLLLLNLPGSRTYLRDYYCSKVSQADYLLPPTDLVMQSGFLEAAFDLYALDAIAEGLSPDAVLRRIANDPPAIILYLAGAASWDEDEAFLHRLHAEHPPIRLIGTGDVFLADLETHQGGTASARPREVPSGHPPTRTEPPRIRSLPDSSPIWSALPHTEAALGDFTTPDLPRFLAGERIGLSGLIWPGSPPPIRSSARTYSVPPPRRDLFPRTRYRYPFCRPGFAVILTDFGCPYRCRFCVMPGLGYKQRPLLEIAAELHTLHATGVRDLLFLDQTFGLPAARARELLDLLKPLAFRWTAFTRADVLTDELLAALKASGCQTLILGVESGNAQVLAAQDKALTHNQLLAAFALCRRHGIRTVATLLFGLPEDTPATLAETMSFVHRLDPDYCSFNVAVPRRGTALRQEVLHNGLANPEQLAMDQSGTTVALPTHAMTREEVATALHQAIRSFYFRPAYLLRRLTALRHWSDLTVLARQAWGLWRRFPELKIAHKTKPAAL